MSVTSNKLVRAVLLACLTLASPLTGGIAPGRVLRIPVAHYQGNYFADAATLAALEERRQVVFRYCDAQGDATAAANPNGSARNIAGICSGPGNVLGMMPHPERVMESLQGGTDGRALFAGLAEALVSA